MDDLRPVHIVGEADCSPLSLTMCELHVMGTGKVHALQPLPGADVIGLAHMHNHWQPQ
jgi:hypothetical protein